MTIEVDPMRDSRGELVAMLLRNGRAQGQSPGEIADAMAKVPGELWDEMCDELGVRRVPQPGRDAVLRRLWGIQMAEDRRKRGS